MVRDAIEPVFTTCQTRYMGLRPKGKRGLWCERKGTVLMRKGRDWRMVCRQHAKSWAASGWHSTPPEAA